MPALLISRLTSLHSLAAAITDCSSVISREIGIIRYESVAARSARELGFLAHA